MYLSLHFIFARFGIPLPMQFLFALVRFVACLLFTPPSPFPTSAPPRCIFGFCRQEMIVAPSQDPGAEGRGTETRTLARFANVFPQVLVMDPTAVRACAVCANLCEIASIGISFHLRRGLVGGLAGRKRLT